MNKFTCKHHTGSYHNKTCAAGVVYADVTPNPTAPGSMFREPCVDHILRSQFSGAPLSDGQFEQCRMQGTCEKRETPTPEEIKAWEEEQDRLTDRFDLVIPLIGKIKAEHNQSWAGVVECPVCKGQLHLRLNVFGGCAGGRCGTPMKKHLHGSCQTEGCVRWAE